LLFGFIYAVYRMNFMHPKQEKRFEDEHHYTFKI